MTPFELGMCVTVYSEAKNQEAETMLFGAYMSEIWHRTERLKPFTEIMDGWKNPVKEKMSDLDMLVKVTQLNAALDGNTISTGEGV